ncbi:MAG: FAD-dependent monooxygenase [Neisseriaceae bacterium]
MQHESILIVGGGPVGATTAISLAISGKSVTLLDSFKDDKKSDGRVLALSHASLAFLENLGLHFKKFGTAINKVHISHNGLGINNIDAKDINLKHLGYTIKYADIVNILYEEMQKYPEIKLKKSLVKNVIPDTNFATVVYDYEGIEESSQDPQILKPSNIITADLVILAEGGNVKVNGINYEQYDYNQQAIIARIKIQENHNNIAYERFENLGPIVLLPHEHEFILVWALSNTLITCGENKQLSKDQLQDMLQKLPFMKRFGQINIVGDLVNFPLKLQIACKRVLDSVVLIGNSSQIVHPVSAQGLNLGLRDVRDLCEVLKIENTISHALLKYANIRKNDVHFVSGFTHFLAKFLEKQNPITKCARGYGIMTLSHCKFLQNKLTNSLVFGV